MKHFTVTLLTIVFSFLSMNAQTDTTEVKDILDLTLEDLMEFDWICRDEASHTRKLTSEVLMRGTQLIRNYSSVALENYTTGDEFPTIIYSKNLLKQNAIKEAFFISKDGYVIAHSDNS